MEHSFNLQLDQIQTLDLGKLECYQKMEWLDDHEG